MTYHMTRWMDARHFCKKIVVDDGAGEPLEYVERVARFALNDFERMFAAHNISIEAVYGDYRLNGYDPQASPRMILVARKHKQAAVSATRAIGSCGRG